MEGYNKLRYPSCAKVIQVNKLSPKSKQKTSYKDVYESIKKEIANGECGSHLASISELCDQHNVSSCTVKRAVDNLKKNKYVYGHQGKCLKINESAIGNPIFRKDIVFYLHLDTMGNPFYLRVLSKVRELLQTSGCLIHFVTSIQQLRELDFIPEVIILSEITDEKEIEELSFVCGREKIIKLNDSQQKYNTVGTNNYEGGYRAAEYLYKMGHRNVGMISRDLDTANGFFDNRYRGFNDFVSKQNDMTIVNSEVNMDTKRREAIFFAMTSLLSKAKVTAIFAFSDVLALGIYSYCDENKIRIPQDISILSFDNLEFSSLLSPPLSTFKEDSDIIAQFTTTLAKQIVTGEENILTNLVNPFLIERKSVKQIVPYET
jgi:LacI family transcriptional regulator